MNSSDYAAVQDALVRMVVPMRREFGVAVDVRRMRCDMIYAQFIVSQALTSQTQPLHDSACLVDRCLRAAAARSASPDSAAAVTVRREIAVEDAAQRHPLAALIESFARRAAIRRGS
ncbi:MAG: hypothetical protein OEW27_00100 [Aquincola sp.]|nr:hypothetical protein [Aquincola sp.]MDH5328323.1 hypothetical protein [Aquincola sp.]